MSDTFEELSSRARRGGLSRAEQQRLDVFLKASPEARIWHDAGRQLDAEDAVLPGDHDAVERVMQRTLATLPRPQPRRRRRLGVLLAVAASFVVSVAAASVGGMHYYRHYERTHLARTLPESETKVTTLAASRSPVVAAPVVVESVSAAAEPAAVAAPLVNGAKTSHVQSLVDPAGNAAGLFSAASLARREGSAGKAIALLDGLQERYPDSREARLSDMTLGSLHLQRGAWLAALEHFRRYLRASPQGELASEALWGEFQALNALGQRAEAARRLQMLVERYPSSAYAAAARAKLKAESTNP